MALIGRKFDTLINGIRNLRGYRCAEQGPFLAHVDALDQEACRLAEQHRGAVVPDRARIAAALSGDRIGAYRGSPSDAVTDADIIIAALGGQ